MPVYYPDLGSVKKTAEIMRNHKKPSERYNGIVPQNETELPLARKQLGEYFREVWHDEIAALEVELAVTEKDYSDKLSKHIAKQFGF